MSIEENFNVMTYIVQNWPSFVEIQENCVRYVTWIGPYIEYLGTKPPKVFEISSKFASNNESDNKRKYMLLGGEAPETFKISSKFAYQERHE